MSLITWQQKGRNYNKTKGEEEKEKVGKSYSTQRIDCDWGLLDLPKDLWSDILCRVPIDSLFSCKCVCKPILQILVDPSFKERHYCSNDHRIIILDRKPPFTLFSVRKEDLEKTFPSFSCQEDEQDKCELYSWQTSSMTSSLYDGYLDYLSGSCNGLVCVSYNTSPVISICNPVLGEYMVLSSPNGKGHVGLGFCPATKEFKVIKFVDNLGCFILTLGKDCWRSIQNVPHPTLGNPIGPSLNGYLHWEDSDYKIYEGICAFNLETEEMIYLPPPAHINREFSENYFFQLAIFEGSLCVGYKDFEHHFEVCVMMDYGVKESWTRMISVDYNFTIYQSPSWRLLNNGIVILGYYTDPLIYWNTTNGTKKLIMSQGSHANVALDYLPSFVSLKDIAGAGNVEVVPRKRHHNFFPRKEAPFIPMCWNKILNF